MVGWHHPLNGHEFKQARETVKGREVWYAAVHGVAKCRTQLNNNQELLRVTNIFRILTVITV